MTKKTKQTSKGFWTRRSYEPLKMTIAISAAAVVILFLFGLLAAIQS